MKQENITYGERLKHYGYEDSQIEEILEFRDSCEHMSFEMFTVLFQQKVLVRTAKLRKPRNLFVSSDGKIWYLNHRNKKYEYCAYFAENTEEND